MSEETYEAAIEKLNTLQSNAVALEAAKKAGAPRKREIAIIEMLELLERIGYKPEDLNRLNVIHVTGTKGKGSTCAFTDSLLRHAVPNWKVGLYTSPHLVAARERIRVNGEPISEEHFSEFFFYVWNKLDQSKSDNVLPPGSKPMYFKFVTLMAFHAFLALKVDATILEVGVGGMFDSTNIVPKPVVTGVTALGLDHVLVLGNTLREIGWQKGGIYKPGVPAFTVEQPEEGLAGLEEQARERKASAFSIVAPIPELSRLKLGLPGKHQVSNATLATYLSHQFLVSQLPSATQDSLTPPTPLSAPFLAGLENARWPGRCQTVSDPSRANAVWHLDGAHTIESLRACAEWYFSPEVAFFSHQETPGSPAKSTRRVLIFNCTHDRDGELFMQSLLSSMNELLATTEKANFLKDHPGFFDDVVFCTNVTYTDGHFKADINTVGMPDSEKFELIPQRKLGAAWEKHVPEFPAERIHVLPSIQHALQVVDSEHSELDEHQNLQVLVTGSLHLVGGVIEVAGLGEVALATRPITK